MDKDSVEKKFLRYVMTSMVTMFLQGLYSIVDGLFVSNMVGGSGLSAINVVWPVIAVIVAIGTGIGAGGSALMSMKQGEGNPEESNTIRANVMILLALVGIAITILFNLCLPPALRIMGAEGDIYHYGMQFGTVLVLGSVVVIFATGLPPMLRNDNRVVSSMVIMISGLLCNTLLDCLFLYVFGLGVRGAALASLVSQCLTVAACLTVMITNRKNPLKLKQFTPQIRWMKKIIGAGISPFGISLTPSLLIMYNNVACIHYGGNVGIAIYSLISSTIGSYRLLLIGVADGIQPLASFVKGAQDYKTMKRIRNRGIRTAVGLSVFLFIFTVLTARYYGNLFGYSKDIIKVALVPILIESTQLIFTGLVRVSNSFFFAVGKHKYSLFMIYFDPLFMTPLLLLTLPRIFGMNGVWISTTISQVILNVIAVYMYRKHNREITAVMERKMIYETN